MLIKKLSCTLLIILLFFPRLSFAVDTNGEFSFAVIGDTRPAEPFGKIPDILPEAVEKINVVKVDFVVHLGDAICLGMNDANISGMEGQWAAFKNEIEKLTMSFHMAPGNEDIWSALSRDHYKKLFSDKLYYSFDYKNSHFVVLDTEVPEFKNDIPATEKLWLENDLKSTIKENIFVFLHRPVMPVLHPMSMNKNTRQYLKDLFTGYKVKAVFSGHEHLYHKEDYNGTAYYITGGGGAPLHNFVPNGAFYHFLIVTVKGNNVKVDVVKVL